MRLISRTIFREIFVTAILGAALFTFVLFLQQAGRLFEFLVRTSGPPKTVAYLFAMVVPVVLQVVPLLAEEVQTGVAKLPLSQPVSGRVAVPPAYWITRRNSSEKKKNVLFLSLL